MKKKRKKKKKKKEEEDEKEKEKEEEEEGEEGGKRRRKLNDFWLTFQFKREHRKRRKTRALGSSWLLQHLIAGFRRNGQNSVYNKKPILMGSRRRAIVLAVIDRVQS